jgi:hypothetical protein
MSGLLIILSWMICIGPAKSDPVQTYYQSPGLRELKPVPLPEQHQLRDDQGAVQSVAALADDRGNRYWYRRIFTPVCLTGECRPVDIGIYWTFSGKYLGIAVYREPLTKTDHSVFSPVDYAMLERILQDEWSDLREYTAEELVDSPNPGADTLDGVTGATKQAVAQAAVKDAVYTTHTIWHLIHDGEPEQLNLLALKIMNEDRGLMHRLLNVDPADYRALVLDGVVSGHLAPDTIVQELILEGLTADDVRYRDRCISAFSRLDVSNESVQNRVADRYPLLAPADQTRLLGAIQKATALSPALRARLIGQFTENAQPWVLIRTLRLLEAQKIALSDKERQLLSSMKTGHDALRKTLDAFLSAR